MLNVIVILSTLKMYACMNIIMFGRKEVYINTNERVLSPSTIYWYGKQITSVGRSIFIVWNVSVLDPAHFLTRVETLKERRNTNIVS